MKLRTVGVLCPLCGGFMHLGSLAQQDTWLGYTRAAFCPCEGRDTPGAVYTLLFDEKYRFKTMIPGGDLFLSSAGNRVHIHDDDEIPF